MPVRTKILRALLALVVTTAASVVAAASLASATGPNLLPFTVTNHTGRADATWLYVLGTDLTSGRLGYVDAAGAFTPWPAGGLPPTPAPDVAIPGPANGGATVLKVPRNVSGRVYFAFGEKLTFFLTPDGLVQPAPWAAGDPNRDILFDWSEFTYNDSGLWLNSSQVDMFAVPHVVGVTGADGVTRHTGQLVDDGRNKVIAGVRAQSGWSGAVQTRADGTVLRVLSPGKAADAGLFSATYLDPYITSAWQTYATRTLTVAPFLEQPDVKYFGRTSGDTMTFTDGSGQRVASFGRPSSSDVWDCDGALAAPNDLVVGPIARTLCAALHRTTLASRDVQPSGGPADFYQGTLTNHYSRIVHANMVDGKAYGFAFDDVQDQESLVHDGDPRAAGIDLSAFGPGGGPTDPPPSPTPTGAGPSPSGTTTPPSACDDGSGAMSRLLQADGSLTFLPRPATSVSLPAAGGNHDGTPTNAKVFTACGLDGRYTGGTTTFDLLVDAGTAAGDGVQVRISYDLTGDGTVDRVETYRYFATDPVTGAEHYRQTQGLTAVTGTLGDLRNGTVRVEVWNAIGATATSLGVGNGSAVILPYSGGTPPPPSPGTSVSPTAGPSPDPTMSPFGPQLYLEEPNLLWQRPAGTARATITAADGTWVGTPHTPRVYRATNLTARYTGGATAFRLLLDAGTAVGNGTQVRVSYDLTGDGSFDRVETYHYYATDPVAGWETYTAGQGLAAATGSLGDLRGGTVQVEVWNAIGAAPTGLAVGDQSQLTLPYTA
ncbi:beta-1,3-glucanase family protein [Micromonospora auratinigra]|uniref:Beta-1,3-glucanase n=1 Tax=Micromonospora auratinigra TaxID=261654 RepID=A0A1A8Z3J0_9ACTN|nr:beta-1,3-glucanase family protein [Micromonospora auratinigra]SBT38493.1 Beta-1,3-glucanase [Micromonospora auratinigra]